MAKAALLLAKKSEDYNRAADGSVSSDRDGYFPLGLASYAQMIHTKSQRLLSLARAGGRSNFESAQDTALDLINYAAFLADWLERTGGAEKN